MEWDRLITEMIRQMIQQFLAQPGEWLTFNQLAYRIRGSEPALLHGIAEAKPDLFVLTRRGNAAKLHIEAVRQIIRGDADLTTLHAIVTPEEERVDSGWLCGHVSDEMILADLRQSSLPSEVLTRNCCWKRICQVRGRNPGIIDSESWRQLCRVRGYLYARQNAAGF